MNILKPRLGSWLVMKIADLANREARVLLAKELRQALRSRGALVTGLLAPIGFLLLAPAQLALREAAKLGFRRAVVPRRAAGGFERLADIDVVPVATLREAALRAGVQ